jgi:hypothetical protein
VDVPRGALPPQPTRLEQLAELAGIDPDELRALLREEIEEAEHKLMQAVLAEAWAASAAVAPAADGPETTPGPHQQRI